MVKNNTPYYIIIILFAISLASCCNKYESRVPTGYPFGGNSKELTFTQYTPPGNQFNYFYSHLSLDSLYIKDSIECNTLFRNVDTNYVSDIDFDKYSLAFLRGNVRGENPEFQRRVLIDNNSKTYTIELRVSTSRCGSGPGPGGNAFIQEFILIPKVPEGYLYMVKKFGLY